ncbi:hypothetical protein JB92DRAFT_3025196, partial [Gautieria morchelliformis]
MSPQLPLLLQCCRSRAHVEVVRGECGSWAVASIRNHPTCLAPMRIFLILPAYEVLSVPQKRGIYDRHGEVRVAIGSCHCSLHSLYFTLSLIVLYFPGREL